jgi:predicted DNA-binding transcriptional regulator AlpA
MNCKFTLKFVYPWRYGYRSHDACFAISRPDAQAAVDLAGRIRLDVVRQGRCARTVMRHAVAEVRSELPDVVLVEAAPDYATLGEVARLVGMSRQAMRKWVITRGAGFPAPVHEVNGSVWHLAEILEWMDGANGRRVDRELVEVARAAAELNLGVEVRRLRHIRRSTQRLIELPRELAALRPS